MKNKWTHGRKLTDYRLSCTYFIHILPISLCITAGYCFIRPIIENELINFKRGFHCRWKWSQWVTPWRCCRTDELNLFGNLRFILFASYVYIAPPASNQWFLCSFCILCSWWSACPESSSIHKMCYARKDFVCRWQYDKNNRQMERIRPEVRKIEQLVVYNIITRYSLLRIVH